MSGKSIAEKLVFDATTVVDLKKIIIKKMKSLILIFHPEDVKYYRKIKFSASASNLLKSYNSNAWSLNCTATENGIYKTRQ